MGLVRIEQEVSKSEASIRVRVGATEHIANAYIMYTETTMLVYDFLSTL